MDNNKRDALIQWVNAILPGPSINSIHDLDDGVIFEQLLKVSDEGLVPENLRTKQERLGFIKQYLEGFYSVTLCPGSTLLNFDLVSQEIVNRKDKEWELGKILLALLEACILEKKNDFFVNTATSLSEPVQMEIMQMLQPMIVNSQDIGNHLNEDFSDILKKSSDMNAHQDAALFFQLVTQGNNMSSRVTSTPTSDVLFNMSRLSNHGIGSPVSRHHALDTSIGAEIASPLRMMTIANSPVTPLGALMQSPQLAQKALIRQKEREIKKLELTLQNERHLRTELELDIHEKTELLSDKENKIKEYETQLKQQRKVKDVIDEIDSLRTEKEQNEKDLNRLHQKLTDLQLVKDQCTILEQENQQLSNDIANMRTEVQTMESLKKSHEEYRTQSHLQSVRVAELERLLQQKSAELEMKHNELINSDEKAKSLSHQVDSLKKDLEEMEEMMGHGGGMVGESMGIISDKRIKELEDEVTHLKSTHVETTKYEQLQQKYDVVLEARDMFEAKFTNSNTLYLEKEAKVDQLQLEISKLNSSINELEESHTKLNQKVKDMDKTIEQLKQSETKLQASETVAIEAKRAAEDEILSLQRDIGRLQTEMKLATQELESTKMASENRRQTLAASIDVAVSERKTVEMRMMKANQVLEGQIEELKNNIQTKQDLHNEEVGDLKSKIQNLQSSLKQSEILLDNEKWTKDNVISALKEEVSETREEFAELEQRLQKDIASLNEVKADLESQIVEQKNTYKQKIDLLNGEISTLKQCSRQKESELCSKIQGMNDEIVALKNELENQKTGYEKIVATSEQKYSKSEIKSREQEETLRREVKVLQDKYESSMHDQQLLSDEVLELKTSLKDKDAFIESLHNELSNYKQCEMELKGQLSQVQNTKDNLQEQLEVLRQQLASEQESHSELVNKISTNFETEISQLKETLASKEASYLDLKQTQEVKLNDLQTSLKKEVEKNIETERVANSKFEQLEIQLAESQEKYNQEVSNNNETITTLNDELEQLRMSSAVTEETLNKDLRKLQSDLSKVRAEYEELNNRYLSVTEQERSLDSRINKLYQQIELLENEKRHAESKNEEMKEKLDDLTGKISLIKKVTESKNTENDKLNIENKNLTEKVEDLNSKLLKECRENDEMRHKRKEMNGVINNLQQQLAEKTSDFDQQKCDLEKSLHSKTEMVSSQESALAEVRQELQNQQEEVVQKSQQIDELKDGLTKLSSEVEALNAQMLEKEEECSRKVNSLNECHDQQLSELHKQCEEKEAQWNKKVDKLKSDLVDCDGEIKRLETENKDVKCLCEELKERIEENSAIHRAEKDSLVQKYKKENAELNDVITKCNAENVKLESKLSCSKTEYEASSRTLSEQTEIIRQDFERRVHMLEEELKHERENMLKLKKQCEEKVSETEKYWQSQLEELESEYSQASAEQKQEYLSQIEEQEMRFQSKFEALMQEREMILANQKMNFQERVNHLETRLSQKQKEIQKLSEESQEEKEKTEADYKQKLSNIESILKKEMANQKDLMNELKQNKERVNELQSALREKRTNYETSLASKTQSWESEMENLKEEYNSKISELEREKNRQVEEEKQKKNIAEQSLSGLQERVEVSLAENNSLKQQLAAVEEEKNQLILEYERTLDHKNSHAEDREKLKITVEKLKSQAQKLEVERNFLKDQMEKKVKELKEELAYNERKWGEESESFKKQFLEENQQKIHLQQQMKNIQEDTENKDKIINQYKKHYAQKKEINLSLQQEISVHVKMVEKYKEKAENLEVELNSVKNSHKTKIESYQNEIQTLRNGLDEQKQKFIKAETEVAPIKAKLQEELNKNKSLQTKVNTMEVQLDYADKQVRDLRNKLDNAGTVLLGDNTEFLKLKKESDVSLMEEDGLMTPYNLRSAARKNSLEGGASQCSTESQYNFKSDEDEKNISPMTLRSQRRTSYSDTNLNATIASTDSMRSTKGLKRYVVEEDGEADVMEWTRLGELSRRNTLCLPHLKTSYPVETQKIQLNMFPDTSLQNSSIKPNGLKKRKQEIAEDTNTEINDPSRQKQAKHGIVYQKPGPPTPGNTNRRHSRGTPGRGLHSPRSPLSTLSRKRTPKRTPKKTPKKIDSENIKPSTAFSIGFTPKNKRLTRQQGFVSASNSSSKGHQPRQPLAVKNCFQQTGV